MTMKIAIIGAGPGGYSAALHAARAGAEVTLIEKREVGGTCLNVGCIPSKIMKHTGELLARGRAGLGLGILGGEQLQLDLPRLQKQMATVIANQRQGLLNLFAAANIRYLHGAAKIEKPGRCRITDAAGKETDLAWDKLILATGSEPHPLPHFPFNQRTILSSTELLQLPQLPRSLAIIGGGAIGCEFASIMQNLGCAVTLIEGAAQLLPIPAIDRDSVVTLTRELKKKGVRLHLNSSVQQLEESAAGMNISLASGPPLLAERVLVAIGRTPNSTGLGLENLALRTDHRGWLLADNFLQTSYPDVYALGDLLGPERIMLAHVAAREGEIAADHALGGRQPMDYRVVPTAIYTDPELASVGLSEQEARAQGFPVTTSQLLFRTNGKAQAMNEISGQAKIVADSRDGRILGLHLIGPQATDLIAEGVVAIHHRLTLQELAAALHAHPTLAELIGATAKSGELTRRLGVVAAPHP